MTTPAHVHAAMTHPPDTPHPPPPDGAAAAEIEPERIHVDEPHNTAVEAGQAAAPPRRTGSAFRTAVADNVGLGLMSASLVALMVFAFTLLENRITGVDNSLNAFADRVGRSFDAQNAKIDRRIDGLAAQIDARIDRLDTRIDARIDGLDTRIDRLDTRIDKLDTKIDELETKIDTRIDTLETKIDARFATQDAKIDDLALKLTALIAALDKTEDVDAALAGELITSAPPAPDIG